MVSVSALMVSLSSSAASAIDPGIAAATRRPVMRMMKVRMDKSS